MNKINSMLGAALLAASTAAVAVDGVSFEYGRSDSGNASVDLYRVGVQWDWNKKLIEMGGWHLGGYWDLSAGYWDNRSAFRTNSSLADIGFTPTFRFQQNTISGLAPYAELAVGFHFLSTTSVSPQRRFGSSFQWSCVNKASSVSLI